jgi:pimeloyl-ACP methyl ester carboxylesterase
MTSHTHFAADRLKIERRTELGMHLRLSGPPSAPAILIIHGLGESTLSFERLLAEPRLARYRQIAPDLIGYGKSTWATEPLDLRAHADLLARLLDQLECAPVVIAGHSMGGVLGLILAERHPDKVRGFLNIEGNISLDDCSFSGKVARHSLPYWLEHASSAFLDSLHESVHASGDDPRVIRAYAASIQMCDPRAYHLNSQELVRESGSETIAPRLAALGLPHLYLYGAPRGTGIRSLNLLQKKSLKTLPIEPAGHWPFLDQQEIFVGAMVRFLESLSS